MRRGSAIGSLALRLSIIVVAGGTAPIRAAMHATKTIPIVMAGLPGDPVELGLVEGLARPGGNIPALQPFPEN